MNYDMILGNDLLSHTELIINIDGIKINRIDDEFMIMKIDISDEKSILLDLNHLMVGT